MNILIATNSKYMVPTSVMLYSLCKSHLDTEIDLYVAYHDLNELSISRMRMILEHFSNKRLHLLDVGDEFAKRISADDRFSYESFYRILALDMLPSSMDRILYLDCDMLVKGDLREMYNSAFGKECIFKACFDIAPYRDDAFDNPKKRSEVPSECDYFNSGMLLINLEYVRRRRSVGYIVEAFVREYDHYPYHDQDILNHMYYDKVEFVPWQLYNIMPGHYYLDTEAFSNGRIRFATYPEINSQNIDENPRYIQMSHQLSKNAKVIHYLWFLKPWNYTRETIFKDLVPFTDYWYDTEIEMYESIEGLEKI